jgi:hypothetical protein
MSPILGGRGAGVRAYGFGGAARPNAPVSVVATDVGTNRAFNNGAASVAFSSGGDNGLPITSYTVTSSPGGFSATGSSSPLVVTGLQSNVQYTYTVTATNAIGTSNASTASAGVTATTVPQTPTITSATRSSNTAVSVAFTGATGGKAITAVTATSSPSVSISSSGTSSPMTATASYAQGTSYTFTITVTNANGTSGASNTSGAVTPFPLPTIGSWSAGTNYPVTSNMYAEARSVGASLAITAGGGYGPSPFSQSPFSWSYNGSAWTFVSSFSGIVFPNLAGDKTTSSAQSSGGYYVVGEEGYPDNQSKFWTPGNSWSTANFSIPNNSFVGSSIAWPSDVWSVTQGSWSNGTFFRTGTGNWSTGVVTPSAGSARGHYAYGRGYTILQGNSFQVLTQTNAGGAYTVAATSLAGATTNGAWIKLNVANGALFYVDTSNPPLAVYRYNSDYTSTLMTSPAVSGWQNGMMASAGSTMFIAGGRINSTFTTTVQNATVS